MMHSKLDSEIWQGIQGNKSMKVRLNLAIKIHCRLTSKFLAVRADRCVAGIVFLASVGMSIPCAIHEALRARSAAIPRKWLGS